MIMKITVAMIIGIVVVILGGIYMLFSKTKDKKEPLTIWQDGNRVRLLLSDDEYDSFDISNIKDNKQKINEKIKEVIKNRAFELKELVDRVNFFDNKNEEFAKELLEIIKNG